MEAPEKKPWQRYLFAGIVFTVLFIFPAIAWFSLQSGLDHHVKSKSELKQLGSVADFSAKDQSNALISPQALRGKVSVLNFLPADPAASKNLAERMAKVHQSYNETEDVNFVSFIPVDSTVTLLDRAIGLGIKDAAQWHLVGLPLDEWTRLSTNAFKLPDPTSVTLVDTSMTVRNYYDVHSNPAMGRMVEHIALVLPKQKRR